MAEKLDKIHIFGSDLELTSKPSGGGGSGMTLTTNNRWLRFNFDDP